MGEEREKHRFSGSMSECKKYLYLCKNYDEILFIRHL